MGTNQNSTNHGGEFQTTKTCYYYVECLCSVMAPGRQAMVISFTSLLTVQVESFKKGNNWMGGGGRGQSIYGPVFVEQ